MKTKIVCLRNDFEESRFVIQSEQTLLEALLDNNIPIDHSCGGMGSCGTCRVFVKNFEQNFPIRNEIESERAQDLKFKENERLACQLECQSLNLSSSELIIEIPTSK